MKADVNGFQASLVFTCTSLLVMLPVLGWIKSSNRLKKVVFPAPVGPTIATVSPGFSDSHWVRDAFGTIAYGFAPVFHTGPDVYLKGIHAADEALDVADLAEMVDLHLRALRLVGATSR